MDTHELSMSFKGYSRFYENFAGQQCYSYDSFTTANPEVSYKLAYSKSFSEYNSEMLKESRTKIGIKNEYGKIQASLYKHHFLKAHESKNTENYLYSIINTIEVKYDISYPPLSIKGKEIYSDNKEMFPFLCGDTIPGTKFKSASLLISVSSVAKYKSFSETKDKNFKITIEDISESIKLDHEKNVKSKISSLLDVYTLRVFAWQSGGEPEKLPDLLKTSISKDNSYTKICDSSNKVECIDILYGIINYGDGFKEQYNLRENKNLHDSGVKDPMGLQMYGYKIFNNVYTKELLEHRKTFNKYLPDFKSYYHLESESKNVYTKEIIDKIERVKKVEELCLEQIDECKDALEHFTHNMENYLLSTYEKNLIDSHSYELDHQKTEL